MGVGEQKHTTSFLLRLLLIVLIIFACDSGIGALLRVYYFRQESGVNYRTTYAIDSTTADIVILGSSRATHHYVPEIFKERLGQTCYNAGCDGTSVLYDYAVFRAVTRRYIPDYIILDITPHSMEYNLADYDRLSVLSPYYKKHSEIRNIVNLKGPSEKVKYLSGIYPFNSLLVQIAMGNTEAYKKRDLSADGYLPLHNVRGDGGPDTLKVGTDNIDENKIRALKNMIASCKKEDINLVLVFSPMWHIISDKRHTDMVRNLCTENGIPYYDLSNHPDFLTRPGYFSDGSHLNNDGARYFTSLLIDSIWPGMTPERQD